MVETQCVQTSRNYFNQLNWFVLKSFFVSAEIYLRQMMLTGDMM